MYEELIGTLYGVTMNYKDQLIQNLRFTKEQLQYLQQLFKARPVSPDMDLSTIQYEAGQQSVLRAIEKLTPCSLVQ